MGLLRRLTEKALGRHLTHGGGHLLLFRKTVSSPTKPASAKGQSLNDRQIGLRSVDKGGVSEQGSTTLRSVLGDTRQYRERREPGSGRWRRRARRSWREERCDAHERVGETATLTKTRGCGQEKVGWPISQRGEAGHQDAGDWHAAPQQEAAPGREKRAFFSSCGNLSYRTDGSALH